MLLIELYFKPTLGFTIDAKVDVNSSPQYKVHNSKGNTYYITASDAYVK
ncbi:hypothetical protein [Bacillus sp. AFS023182]|nr:hypothetical protein [Bacillus sp. AFS023182]